MQEKRIQNISFSLLPAISIRSTQVNRFKFYRFANRIMAFWAWSKETGLKITEEERVGRVFLFSYTEGWACYNRKSHSCTNAYILVSFLVKMTKKSTAIHDKNLKNLLLVL